ncbi:MAG: rod shape-determining protein MreC [Clostridiaceae bacterium]|nr:rod shape-determining protein MreC [Clostridiaceae bacterium]
MKILKNKLAVTVILLSVSFLTMIGVSVGRNKATFPESGIGSIINKIQGHVYKAAAGSKGFLVFFTHYSDVKKENEDLKKKINDLYNMEQRYGTLKDDNESLRALLYFEKANAGYEYKGGDVVGRVGGDWLEQLGINIGSKDGISAGMVAIDVNGCFVGKVTKVGLNWATIETLSNSNIAVSAIVGGSPVDNGIVKGYRGINNSILGMFNFLPLDSAIKKGDVVVTRGLEQSYPKDIRIGTVTDVHEDKGKLAKNATIQPFVDFKSLQKIAIIIPKNKRDIKY